MNERAVSGGDTRMMTFDVWIAANEPYPPTGFECIGRARMTQVWDAAQAAATECLRQQLAEAQADSSTAWAQAHRLALELECLIMDTKDNAIVSKWWDSAFEAIEEYNKLKPGAAEDAEAWAKMRKAEL